MRAKLIAFAAVPICVVLAGCATPQPYDYTNFRAHPPRSIVVLPPTNQSPEVKATYGYLSTVTMPLAEKGYYIFPAEVVDEFMKDNGLPTANEMQAVPLSKIQDILGADAALYVNVTQYGTRYEILDSVTEVSATARLVDVRTGIQLWDGNVKVAQSANANAGGGNPLAMLIAAAVNALVNQIIANSTDQAHPVARTANIQLFYNKNNGLPDGPYLTAH